MLANCLKCKRNTENINPRVSKTSNGTKKFFKFAVRNSNKYWFSKE